ncbi:unnamed protein product [Cochlearia groenlandica]
MDSKVMKMDRAVFMKDGGEFSRDVYLKYGVNFTGKSQIRSDDEWNLTQRRRDSNTTMNRDRIEGETEFVHSGDSGYAQIRHGGDDMSRSMFSQSRFMRNCESKVIEMNRWDGKIDHDDVKLFHDDHERVRLIFEQDREMQKSKDATTVRRSNTTPLKVREPISVEESIQDDNIMLGMESIQSQQEHRQHKKEEIHAIESFGVAPSIEPEMLHAKESDEKLFTQFQFQVKHKWRFKLLRPVSDSADVVTTQEAEKWRFKYLGVLLKPHGDDREFLAFITENVMAPLVFSSLWASLLSWGKVTMICGRDFHVMLMFEERLSKGIELKTKTEDKDWMLLQDKRHWRRASHIINPTFVSKRFKMAGYFEVVVEFMELM